MPKGPNQKDLAKYIDRIEKAENYRDTTYRTMWTDCYKRWRNYTNPIIDPDTKQEDRSRSNINIPYTFVQVETILPRIVESLFASRPYVGVKDRRGDAPEYAGMNETLLDWQMNERMDIKDIFHSGIKECCIYGTTVAFTGWRIEQREITRKELAPVVDPETGLPEMDIDPMTGQQIPVQDYQPVRRNEIEYDDPEVKFLDLGLFYVDPQAEDIDDARYCGHIEFKTKEQLQKMIDIGIYQIDWEKVPKETNSNKAREYRMSSIGMSIPNGQESAGDDDLFEVLHYYEDKKRVVIINRKWICLEGENPFWHGRKPYRKGVYCMVPHEFYGMGVVELCEDLQNELNTERNMRIDYRAFLLRRMFKVRRGANINKKQLKWRQGGLIEVDDMDDIAEFGIGDNSSSSFMAESGIKQDMQDATGGHDVVMGRSSPGEETATTTMSKDQNASMRFKMVISNLERKLLVGIARLMLQLNQQFIDDERVLRVSGEGGDQWPTITPEGIQGEFDLIARGASTDPLANREVNKGRMVELYTVMANEPLLMQFPNKRRNLVKRVIEAFDIKDWESILPTDEELGMMMQQQQQEQQMMAQQQQQQMMMQEDQRARENARADAETITKVKQANKPDKKPAKKGGK